LMDSDLQPEVQNQVFHEIRHQYLSAEHARRVLGWSPRFTLDEGLERTIDWYKQFIGVHAAIATSAGVR
jgi:CDP-glucose 4,6-dehydratase